MNLRRSIQGSATALALVLSGCSWSDSDVSSPFAEQTPEPSPTPTEFDQSFADSVSGEAAEIASTAEHTGPGLTSDNIGSPSKLPTWQTPDSIPRSPTSTSN